MKIGKDLKTLAAELARVRETSRDFIVPAGQMFAVTRNTPEGAFGIGFETKEGKTFATLNGWSHGQLASYADVPKAYYDRLLAQRPDILSANVNHGLALQTKDRRMLRLLDGNVRALVSPKYRRLDSADLADATLPALLDAGMSVVSSDLTDRRFYLRATTERLRADVAVGDTVQAGIMISNSDVGAGSLRVEPFLLRLVCLNGMVMQHALKKAHLGRSLATSDDALELLSESTIRMGEATFWAEVRDVVTACLSPEIFHREVDKMKAAAGQKITNFDLQEVVELTTRRVGLANVGEATKKSIVEALASGGQGAGLTRWGLVNAMTAAASADHLDFDASVELERAGAAVLDLSRDEWRSVAEAKRA